MNINYMVMNAKTAECDVFGNKTAALKNATAGCFIFPIDFADDKEDAELLLYPNVNKSAKLPYVADYISVDNNDLRNVGEDYPVRIALG